MTVGDSGNIFVLIHKGLPKLSARNMPRRPNASNRLAESAAKMIRARLGRLKPRLGLVLGSGFHGVAAIVKPKASLDYTDMPGFPKTGVKGHSGRLIVGTVARAPIMIFSGRAHYYEGYNMEEITFPVRVMARLGVTDMVVTNAAGGINPRLRPGDFMLLRDHLNLMGVNPLRPSQPGGWDGEFLDLTQAYDADLSGLFKTAAKKAGITLKQGVYAAVSGPSYETPAEVKMYGKLGASAVGMSTVPEVVVARRCGLRVAGISLITNPAAGIGAAEVNHSEVLEIGNRAETMGQALVRQFCQLYAER